MERVRQATTEDLDRLVELVAGFEADRARHRGGDLVRHDDAGGTPPEPVVGSLAPYVSDPGRTALLGTLDDWVAGAALCRVDDGGAGRRGVLDLCFVESGAREVGLGHLLLDAALGWFRDTGCTGVDGTAYPGDRGAKNFFESAGFKARLLVMHRPLD
jgi:GNAT superfamily N-acetyltransferase